MYVNLNKIHTLIMSRCRKNSSLSLLSQLSDCEAKLSEAMVITARQNFKFQLATYVHKPSFAEAVANQSPPIFL